MVSILRLSFAIQLISVHKAHSESSFLSENRFLGFCQSKTEQKSTEIHKSHCIMVQLDKPREIPRPACCLLKYKRKRDRTKLADCFKYIQSHVEKHDVCQNNVLIFSSILDTTLRIALVTRSRAPLIKRIITPRHKDNMHIDCLYRRMQVFNTFI